MLKNVLKRLGLLLLGLVLTAIVVEISVRIFDPFGISHFFNMNRYMTELVELRPDTDRILVHRPNMHLSLYGWDIRTDSHGLRGPEREIPKPPGVRRVLFIGDSVTFGWGVKEEDCFVSMVEKDLNRSSDGPKWETVNGGHLYHDSTQERAVLEEVGLLYEPDIVFLVFVGNDIHPTKQMRKPASERPVSLTKDDLEEVEARAKLRDRLAIMKPVLPFTHRLTEFLITKYRNYEFRQIPGNEERDPYLLDRAGIDFELGWELSKKAILEMNALAVENGATFVVLDTGKKEELEEFCADQGLNFVRIVHGPDEKVGIRNSMSDPHPNRRGHRQYADKILRAMNDLDLIH